MMGIGECCRGGQLKFWLWGTWALEGRRFLIIIGQNQISF